MILSLKKTLLLLLLPLNDQVWSSSRHNRQRKITLPHTQTKAALQKVKIEFSHLQAIAGHRKMRSPAVPNRFGISICRSRLTIMAPLRAVIKISN